jgi:hypothetical protein
MRIEDALIGEARGVRPELHELWLRTISPSFGWEPSRASPFPANRSQHSTWACIGEFEFEMGSRLVWLDSMPGMETNEKPLPTTERLARALEASANPALVAMAAKARQGYYDDFRSDVPDPIRRLVRDLNAAGAIELAERAMRGEFEATEREAQEWMLTAEGRVAAQQFTKLLPFARVRRP